MAQHNTQNNTAIPDIGFIRQSALLPLLGFSATTLWRRVKQGTFPQPIKLSVNVTAWRVEEVREWISSQGAAKAA